MKYDSMAEWLCESQATRLSSVPTLTKRSALPCYKATKGSSFGVSPGFRLHLIGQLL